MIDFYQLHSLVIVEKNNLELRTQQNIIDKENQDHAQSFEKSGTAYTIPEVFHFYGASQNGFSINLSKSS